jgi:peptidoglycan/LPS O-acetylase OafA/YrhL
MTTERSAGGKLHALQAARAIAAWLVVIDHVLLELSGGRPDNRLTHIAWTLGNTGVDVFFVVSGFIMSHICWDGFGRPGEVQNFLRRRLLRIVPLYWLMTIVALVYHRVSATHGARAGLADLARSIAFIPYVNEEGSRYPILPSGWTLSYEMMFYGIFALGLFQRRQIGLPAIGLALILLVAIGPQQPSETIAYLASPIVLWFLAGMGLAVLWHRWRLSEPAWLVGPAKSLEPFGDASYSTYLIHGFVVTTSIRLWSLTIGPPSLWIVPVSVVLATVIGLVTYRVIERPLLRVMTRPSKAGLRAALS